MIILTFEGREKRFHGSISIVPVMGGALRKFNHLELIEIKEYIVSTF